MWKVQTNHFRRSLFAALAVALLATTSPSLAQFVSGSDGSDGAFNPTAAVVVDLSLAASLCDCDGGGVLDDPCRWDCPSPVAGQGVYDAAQWVSENVGEEETIGVFQSGAIGYLSDRRVINLDGKVNSEALYALQNGTLPDYVNKLELDVLLDNTHVMKLFMGLDANRIGVAGSTQIVYGEAQGMPGWVGFRLNPVELVGPPAGDDQARLTQPNAD